MYKKCYTCILNQVRVKVEYDFKLQRFIILYQNQKFIIPPPPNQMADFNNIIASPPPKCLDL